MDRQLLGQTLHHLMLRDILAEQTGDERELASSYVWRLSLLGLWVEKYKSLSRVLEETLL